MTAKLRIDKEHGQRLFREMLRIRRFESKCAELYQAQKIRGFLHLYDGEEAIAVGIMQALEERDAELAAQLVRVHTMRLHDHVRRAWKKLANADQNSEAGQPAMEE